MQSNDQPPQKLSRSIVDIDQRVVCSVLYAMLPRRRMRLAAFATASSSSSTLLLLLLATIVIRSSSAFSAASVASSSSNVPLPLVSVPSDQPQQKQPIVSVSPPDIARNETTTTEQQYAASAISRAWEIASVLTGDVVAPCLASLLWQGGWPASGDEFWSRRSSLHQRSNAERVVAALEQLGATYVKFGQALSARADLVPPVLADALSKLQDEMATSFDTDTAKAMMQRELSAKGDIDDVLIQGLVDNLSLEPVGSASIAQVYQSHLMGYGPVAVKIQRPEIRALVQQDTVLLRQAAQFLESLGWIATKLVDAVDEFMARVAEELDYSCECDNMAKFASLYSYKTGSCENVNVVVPEVLRHLCTENIIVMEWIEGTKVRLCVRGDCEISPARFAIDVLTTLHSSSSS